MAVTVAERINGLLKAKGLRRSHVARAATIQPSSLTRYGSGKNRRVGSTNLAKLAAALDVSADYLLGLRADLNELPFGRVAAEESFRIFCELRPMARVELRRFRAVLLLQSAPRTVSQWKAFDELLQAFVGNAPGSGKPHADRSRVIPASKRFGGRR